MCKLADVIWYTVDRVALLLLQGFVEILRCVLCLKHGEWPNREEDVEEVDVDKLKAMVHADEPPAPAPAPAAAKRESAS